MVETERFVPDFLVLAEIEKDIVGAESDELVNICSFAVRCYRRWPSTQ